MRPVPGLQEPAPAQLAPVPGRSGRHRGGVLTHAHIDHSGYLPRLARQGFKGPIYTTEATRDLCAILLPDSGHLQEREAEFINRHGISKHHPSLPLYTQQDAERMLGQFRPVRFGEEVKLPGGVTARFVPAGHILGAAIIELEADGRKIVFSGDLGRSNNPTMLDPTPIARADYLLCESTYGDRLHEARDPEEALAEVVGRTVARGGTVVIPAFAVGRTQTLLYHLERLKRSRRIPDIPVYLDSPMAIDVSDVFCRHPEEHRLSAAEAKAACGVAHYAHSVEESKALDADGDPKIIISASGMATGGRVLHHIKRFAPDPRNTILFAGFQAGGTRGASMTARGRERQDLWRIRAGARRGGQPPYALGPCRCGRDHGVAEALPLTAAYHLHRAWRAGTGRYLAPSHRGRAGLDLPRPR